MIRMAFQNYCSDSYDQELREGQPEKKQIVTELKQGQCGVSEGIQEMV